MHSSGFYFKAKWLEILPQVLSTGGIPFHHPLSGGTLSAAAVPQ